MENIQERSEKCLERSCRPRTDPFLLESGEVHLWWASLHTEIQHLKYFYRILSDQELEKAACFYYQQDREYFMISRGILRVLLGRYLKKEPECLLFTCHRFGKPWLDTTSGNLPLRFNLSHSHGLAVYALSGTREVGIDLESTGTDINIEELAETFFNLREINDIMRRPSNRRKESLLQYWAFKEAYLKATGQGNSFPFKMVEISLSLNRPEVLLKTGSHHSKVSSCSMHRLDAPQGYVAALAIEGQEGLILKSYQWETSIPGFGGTVFISH